MANTSIHGHFLFFSFSHHSKKSYPQKTRFYQASQKYSAVQKKKKKKKLQGCMAMVLEIQDFNFYENPSPGKKVIGKKPFSPKVSQLNMITLPEYHSLCKIKNQQELLTIARHSIASYATKWCIACMGLMALFLSKSVLKFK